MEFLYFIGILLLTMWLYFFLLSLTIDFFDYRFPEKRVKAQMYFYEKRLREEQQKSNPSMKKITKYQKILSLLDEDICLLKLVDQKVKECEKDKNTET